MLRSVVGARNVHLGLHHPSLRLVRVRRTRSQLPSHVTASCRGLHAPVGLWLPRPARLPDRMQLIKMQSRLGQPL